MKTFKQLTETIKEVQEHQALVEHIESINDTGYLTEDLVTIIETHKRGVWSEALDSKQFDDHLEKLRQEARSGV